MMFIGVIYLEDLKRLTNVTSIGKTGLLNHNLYKHTDML